MSAAVSARWFAILLLVTGSAASAAPAGAELPAAIALPCLGCHQWQPAVGPASAFGLPLASYTPVELAEQLRLLRSGQRQAAVMNRLARGLSDAEIQALAAALGTADGPLQ